MTTSAIVIALAGGAGAALGGAIAQGAGFFVEAYKVRKRAEQQRNELRADLRREKRAAHEARQAEFRARRADAYDDAALRLEAVLRALDWFAFGMRRDDERVTRTRKGGPTMTEIVSKRFTTMYDTMVANGEEIRRLLITVGSDEMDELRRLLYLAYTVLQEWHPSYAFSLGEGEVRLWFIAVENGVAKKAELREPRPAEHRARALYRADVQLLREVCVWGLAQIRWEQTGQKRPSPLPFRAAGYEEEFLD